MFSTRMAVTSKIVGILVAVAITAAAPATTASEDGKPTSTVAPTLPSRPDYPYNRAARKFYKLHWIVATWNNARDICRREGAVLAFARTQEEREALYALQSELTGEDRSANLWIGLHSNNKTSGDVYHHPEHLTISTYLAPGGSQMTSDISAKFPFVCEISEAAACNAPGYTLGPDVQSCYKLNKTKLPWATALLTCVHEGSRLAIINSKEEADHLVAVVRAAKAPLQFRDVILGFHDLYAKGNFFTVDGSPLGACGYNEWGAGEPNNAHGKEQCGSMRLDGKLNDIPCNYPTAFICERKAIAPRV